jgi:hypothetical protein
MNHERRKSPPFGGLFYDISLRLSDNGSAIPDLIASRIPGIEIRNNVSSIEFQSSSETKIAAPFLPGLDLVNQAIE